MASQIATWRFVQQLVQVSNKRIIKFLTARTTGSLWGNPLVVVALLLLLLMVLVLVVLVVVVVVVVVVVGGGGGGGGGGGDVLFSVIDLRIFHKVASLALMIAIVPLK